MSKFTLGQRQFPTLGLRSQQPKTYVVMLSGGKSDVCQCFRCHVKLSAWERDDDAIKEHYKWSPQCEYIKMVGSPPPRPPGYRFGSSPPSFGGFGTGSSNMVKPVDPKVFQT